MNYARINLTKHMQDLDTENYKHCREKIKKSLIFFSIFILIYFFPNYFY